MHDSFLTILVLIFCLFSGKQVFSSVRSKVVAFQGFAESSSFEMKPEPDLRQVFDGKDVDRMGHLINEALLKVMPPLVTKHVLEMIHFQLQF